ncbi:Helix-turn-helix domain-containing protein [Pedobacter caeni]|uniref:Helix-turn-helix domain-containing protein n=2 Tax=Pedobacter caeni TaxID=288992 RepID=A0A1M5BSG9_9SPHI|nr:Helix-turn-helix domain-containing protein [Pedobacter caeni]
MYGFRCAMSVNLSSQNSQDMKTTTDAAAQTHQGKNVKRFREMLGIRQEGLADQLGPEWSQKRISLIESREIVEPDLLKSIAEVLKIPVQVLENFNEQAAINYFNTFTDDSIFNNVNNGVLTNNINPLEVLIEAMKELKTVYGENRELYTSLLNLEREKNAELKAKLA